MGVHPPPHNFRHFHFFVALRFVRGETVILFDDLVVIAVVLHPIPSRTRT